MNRLYAFLIFICSTLGGTNAFAGDPLVSTDNHAILPNILFKRFFSSNGLPDERIRSIFQDHNGYLWIGTMNGICRYDGYSFKNFFKTKNNNSISGNWAYTITEDASHNIWIGTNEGFSKFDQEKETFENFSLPNRLVTQQSKRVNSLVFDTNGMLWIGGKLGLIQYNPIANTFKQFPFSPLNINVSKIILGKNNYLWAATDKGLVHYNLVSGSYDFFSLQIKPNAYGDKIWSLLEDNENLFIGTASSGLLKLPHLTGRSFGAFQYLNKYNSGDESLENTQVFDIRKSSIGDFWLGTEKGLAKISKLGTTNASLDYYRNSSVNEKSISSDRVYCIFIDKTNVLWCGTEVGLNNLQLSALPFNYYSFSGLNMTDQVRGIYSANGKDIWLATYKSGFYRYNTTLDNTHSFNFKPDNSFFNGTRSVIINKENVLVGTLDGIIQINGNGNNYQNILQGNAVFAMYKDRKSKVWVGTNNGLFRLDGNGAIESYATKFATAKRFTSPFVRSIFEDHSGNIWVGFENGGIAFINPQTDKPVFVTSKSENEGVFGSTIYSIAEYPDNTLWIGSESGLTKMSLPNGEIKGVENATFKNYSVQNGLPDKSVNGILSDENGHLWISSIKGLVKFDISTEVFQNYLPNLYFNHGCCYKLSKHQFYYGTSDGFIEFDPAAILEDKYLPEVAISDVKLFNQSIKIDAEFNGDVILNHSLSSTKKLSFNYKNNVFTLDFAALHFANPEQNMFAYKMEGFDKDWIQATSSSRSATYTNLDPGTYTFKLKAANYLGIWNDTPVELKISILPPPWKTWWALLIYLLMAITFLYYFTIYVLDQIKQKHQLRYEQIEKNQLKNLDALKTQFFTDISHEFRTPLSLILGPSEEILASNAINSDVRHKAQLINRNSKKLLYLIDELMTFQKLDQGKLQLKPQQIEMLTFVKDIYQNFQHLAQKKEIEFTITADKDCYLANVDAGKMEMVLNNLLFNAFKYVQQQGVVTITMQSCNSQQLPSPPPSSHPQWMQVSVEDNGKGINDTDFSHLFDRYFQSNNAIKGTGVGLSLTKSLIELHGGIITANSEPGVKTSFSFYLPIEADLPATMPAKESFAIEQNYVFDYDINDLIDDSILSQGEHFDRIKSKDTLLLVDDNVEVLDYLELVFQNQYNIARAENGSLALEYLQHHEPDLIISDVMMPEMDGITLCKEIKTNVLISHIPIILLTAKSTIENTLEGLKIGADDYVPKPFYPDVLRVKVQNFIEAKKRFIEKFVQTEGGVVIPKNITHNPLDEEFMKNVLAAIHKNIDNEEFSVEELGSMVAMSRSNLFRKLKAITGQTPVEFIYFIRMNRAMQLLLERKHSVSQISFEVGFKSPSSFTKSFKKQFGMAPTDYLNNAIAKQKEEEEE